MDGGAMDKGKMDGCHGQRQRSRMAVPWTKARWTAVPWTKARWKELPSDDRCDRQRTPVHGNNNPLRFDRSNLLRSRKENIDDSGELPLGVTYVIDREGIIRFAFVDADYRKRAEPADVIAVLRNLGKEALSRGNPDAAARSRMEPRSSF